MKGLENFKGLANGDFVRAAVLTAATIFASPAVKAGDNPVYPPELEPGNCAPASEMQEALKSENQRFVMIGEANVPQYNEHSNKKLDDNGEVVRQPREFLVTANSHGEWYTLVGNAEREDTSTQYCTVISGQNLKVVNNHVYKPEPQQQLIPYEDAVTNQTIQYQRNGEAESDIFAQGHGEPSNGNATTFTIFLTSVEAEKGRGFAYHSSELGDEGKNVLYHFGDEAKTTSFANQLAEAYRDNSKLSLN